MIQKPSIIKGGKYADTRGTISFVNDFHFEGIQRFYVITHSDSAVVRAWQGHQFETKYFYCLNGIFLVKLLQIDDWEKPSLDLKIETYKLKNDDSKLLVIPPGYANGFKALVKGSQLLVYSDKTFEQSLKDDFRYDKNYWFNWEVL